MYTEIGLQFCSFLLLAIDGGAVSFTFRPSYSTFGQDPVWVSGPVRLQHYQPRIPGSSQNLFPLAPFTSSLSVASSHRNIPPPEVALVCYLSHAILDARKSWLLQMLYISV